MRTLTCERCGGRLRLSLSDNAYLCAHDPVNHTFPRSGTEQRWIAEHQARAQSDIADVDASLAFAGVYGAIGVLSFAAGDPERARAYWTDELTILEAVHRAHASDERVMEALLEALGVQAQLAEESGQTGPCLTVFERMLALADPLHDARPDDDERARAVSLCLNGLGRMHRILGHEDTAREFFERDIVVVSALCVRRPEDSELATDLAIAHFNAYLVSTGAARELAHLQQAIRIVDAAEAAGQLTEQAAVVRDRARTVMQSALVSGGEDGEPDAARGARPSVKETLAKQHAERWQWLVREVDEVLKRKA